MLVVFFDDLGGSMLCIVIEHPFKSFIIEWENVGQSGMESRSRITTSIHQVIEARGPGVSKQGVLAAQEGDQ